MELVRLEGADHPVYRCKNCGYLFSPPDVEGLPPGAAPSVSPEEAQQQLERVAAVRPRRRRRGPSAGQ